MKNFWNRFIWVVTDASMGAGRGGGGFREGKYYRITLSLEGIDYYKGAEGGWLYMIFHEIAHWTASGILSNKQRFQHWQTNGGTGTYDYNSPDFQQDEIFANKIAKVFTDAFGLPIRIDVPFGY